MRTLIARKERCDAAICSHRCLIILSFDRRHSRRALGMSIFTPCCYAVSTYDCSKFVKSHHRLGGPSDQDTEFQSCPLPKFLKFAHCNMQGAKSKRWLHARCGTIPLRSSVHEYGEDFARIFRNPYLASQSSCRLPYSNWEL